MTKPLLPGDVCVINTAVMNCDEVCNSNPYVFRPASTLIPARPGTLIMIVCDGDLIGYTGQWLVVCSNGIGLVWKWIQQREALLHALKDVKEHTHVW